MTRVRAAPPGTSSSPNGMATTIIRIAWTMQDRHVPQRATGEHREAAHRGDPHPLDDAVAKFGDEAEPGEGRREEAGLDQQARDEPVEGAGDRPGRPGRAFEQRPEQHAGTGWAGTCP